MADTTFLIVGISKCLFAVLSNPKFENVFVIAVAYCIMTGVDVGGIHQVYIFFKESHSIFIIYRNIQKQQSIYFRWDMVYDLQQTDY